MFFFFFLIMHYYVAACDTQLWYDNKNMPKGTETNKQKNNHLGSSFKFLNQQHHLSEQGSYTAVKLPHVAKKWTLVLNLFGA